MSDSKLRGRCAASPQWRAGDGSRPGGRVGRIAQLAAVCVAALPAALAAVLFAGPAEPALAQPRDLKAVDRVPTITYEAALAAAQAALADCRRRGATVAVAVVDRAGIPVVMVRDPLAGMHTPETAVRKAWTAVSFRGATTELVTSTAPNGPNGGIRHLPNVAMVGGGLVLQAAGSLVGGIGVSGAPGGDMDEACAKAGIGAIGDALELG